MTGNFEIVFAFKMEVETRESIIPFSAFAVIEEFFFLDISCFSFMSARHDFMDGRMFFV